MLRDSESAATLIVRAAHFSCQTQDINCGDIVSADLAARSFALFFNPRADGAGRINADPRMRFTVGARSSSHISHQQRLTNVPHAALE